MAMKALTSIAAGVLAIGGLMTVASTQATEGGVKAGFLTCEVASGWGFVFGSSREVKCTYSHDHGSAEHYLGHIRKFGVDLGYQASGVIVWAVVAPTENVGKGALAGDYGGVSGEASVGIGAGAHVLVGGFKQSFTLQPVSLEGATGLNVAGGIEQLTLEFAALTASACTSLPRPAMRIAEPPAGKRLRRLVLSLCGYGTAALSALAPAPAEGEVPIPLIDATDASGGSGAYSGSTTPPQAPSSAAAPTAAGAYLEIGAGANFLEGMPFVPPAESVRTGSQLTFDAGPAVAGALGYAFGNSWRAEFELGYRSSPANGLASPGGGTTALNLAAFSYMVNLLYDFDLSRYGYPRWLTHAGGGIGAVNLQPDKAPAATVFGGQAIAGVEYVLTPTVLVGVDYRYIGTTAASFSYAQDGVPLGRAPGANFNDHSVVFTLRWKFGGR